MVSLERFNAQNHRYINYISWCNRINCYSVSGCIGTRFYTLYNLAQDVKKYNAEAKSMGRRRFKNDY